MAGMIRHLFKREATDAVRQAMARRWAKPERTRIDDSPPIDRPITLPTVGGVTYEFHADTLYADGVARERHRQR